MAEISAGEALTHQAKAAPSGQTNMVAVAKSAGVGPFSQMLQMMTLKKAPNQISAHEYYDFQLYRPDLSKAAKSEFLGEQGSFALNLRLSPPGLTHMRGFLSDKVALTSLFTAWGLPTTRLRAVFARHRGLGNVPTLRSAAEIEGWLLAQTQFPIFGKPAKGCQARGTVRIDGIDHKTGLVSLANGARAALQGLAAEIVDSGENDYVFQDVVAQHPGINAMIGSENVSTLRLVTVMEDEQPRLLYAVWKLGSAKTMSDNFWQGGSLISHLDAVSGQVLKCRSGSGLKTVWVDKHPVTGAAIVGTRAPNYAQAVDLAKNAHAAFPVNGVLGWDIALTENGACLIECNENTGHALYQYAADRGVMNDDFKPVFARVIARNARTEQSFDARRKGYLAAKAKF